jgi:hypothetical protein
MNSTVTLIDLDGAVALLIWGRPYGADRGEPRLCAHLRRVLGHGVADV